MSFDWVFGFSTGIGVGALACAFLDNIAGWLSRRAEAKRLSEASKR